ncbi:MAG: esterase-like activity of phytase family protein, partial [Cyanobacteria bacterium P01_C01_bin.120]
VEAIDNLEGMTLGPPLPDGSATLWLISDDNFSDDQTTQVWLFRLAIAPSTQR